MPELLIRDGLVRGGFAEVYRGVLRRDGEHQVAIHVLRVRAEEGSRDFERLLGEVRSLVELRHPGVPRIHDVVVIDGRAAIVTERSPGRDLAELLRSGGLPPRAVFEVIAQVAAALDAAWESRARATGKPRRLVHRGIHPGVIRVGPHGGVHLSDFAMAPVHDPSAPLGAQGTSLTRYRAPEVLLRHWSDPHPGGYGHEADVFALGCTMFEALTGEGLFGDLSLVEQRQVMGEPTQYRRFTSDRLEAHRAALQSDRALALVRAMTAFRKTERPPAAEVAARCDLISDGIPGPALAEWARQRTWPDPRSVGGPLVGRTVSLPEAARVGPASSAEPERRSVPGHLRRIEALPEAPEPSRDPVLGELGARRPDRAEPALGEEGPMPYSTAELVALFGESGGPPLVPPRPVEPGVIRNPDRVPQLLRQQMGRATTAPGGPPQRPGDRQPEIRRAPAHTSVPVAPSVPPLPPREGPAAAVAPLAQSLGEGPRSASEVDDAPTELFDLQEGPTFGPGPVPPTGASRTAPAEIASFAPEEDDPPTGEHRARAPGGPEDEAVVISEVRPRRQRAVAEPRATSRVARPTVEAPSWVAEASAVPITPAAGDEAPLKAPPADLSAPSGEELGPPVVVQRRPIERRVPPDPTATLPPGPLEPLPDDLVPRKESPRPRPPTDDAPPAQFRSFLDEDERLARELAEAELRAAPEPDVPDADADEGEPAPKATPLPAPLGPVPTPPPGEREHPLLDEAELAEIEQERTIRTRSFLLFAATFLGVVVGLPSLVFFALGLYLAMQ